MREHDDNIEEVLGKILRSTPQNEMEAAGTRVLQRLRREGGGPAENQVERQTHARSWGLAAAAVVVFAVTLSILLWPGGSAAVIEAADNGLYRVLDEKLEPLRIGEKIEAGETIRANGDTSAMLTIDDGSRIEMRSKSEVEVDVALDGVRIRLNDGSVLVSAAKEPKWQLYVQTKDTNVSVLDTVSLVTAEERGSRVAVLQGEARVEQGGTSKWLRRGEQIATVPWLEPRSVAEAISWSRRAEAFLPFLQSTAIQAPTPPAPPAAIPGWEAVSIRPCDPGNAVPGARGNNGAGENFTVSPGRFSTFCMRLSVLMNLAYVRNGEPLLNSEGLSRNELIRGPEWISSSKLSDRYTIEAVAEGTPDRATILGPMLRALLEDRFQLKSHREMGEVPMYALTVAKGGLKIKPINDADCTPNDQAGFRVWIDLIRRGEKGFCGFLYGDDVRPGTTGWGFGGHTMDAVATILSRWVRKHVVDQTGIPGRFRFYLEVASNVGGPELDGVTLGLEVTPPDVPLGPDVFSAIQDQLGLRLVDGGKGPHQFIVVDHAERPSEN